MSRVGPRNHRAYWAFLGHRLSGLALAIFLPLHFLVLGLALEDAAALDGFLRFSELPFVKAAEWGLLVLLSLHLIFGSRLLAMEFHPWKSRTADRRGWIMPGVAISILVGVVFLVGAL